jgi:hypothetical protein
MRASDAAKAVREATAIEESRKSLAPPAKQRVAPNEVWMDDLVQRLVQSRTEGHLSEEGRTLLMIATETLMRHGSTAAVEDFAQRLALHGLVEEAKLVRGQIGLPKTRRLIGPN